MKEIKTNNVLFMKLSSFRIETLPKPIAATQGVDRDRRV